jgi:signal transduction histidine kinase
MKHRLLWKILLIDITPVIIIIILVIWFAIDQLAAKYFMALIKEYDVNPTDIHQMFLRSVHLYLLWATIAAFISAFVLSYFLIGKILQPLTQMTEITQKVAAGDFSKRAAIGSTDEVGQLGLAFNRMADSLEKIEQLRKNLVADVAHELRTPLTNLRGFIEALKDEVVPPSRETFSMLHDECMRLGSLVENLQQLAKADAAKAYLNKEKIHLPEMIHQMLAMYRTNFSDKNITIQAEIANDAAYVFADREKLLQAMRNLFENAWKYTPAGNDFHIVVIKQNQGAKIAFRSTGVTIDKNDLPLIFERFFRVDRSRSRDAGGAGIGLAIVRELVEAHGGQVGAESDANQTLIWIMLP